MDVITSTVFYLYGQKYLIYRGDIMSKKSLMIIVIVLYFVSVVSLILYYPFMVSGTVRNYFMETNQITEESVIHYNSKEDSFELYESPEVDGFSTVYLKDMPKKLQTLVNIYEFLFIEGVVILL